MQRSLSPAAHSDKRFGFLQRSYVLPHLNINNARSFLTRVIWSTLNRSDHCSGSTGGRGDSEIAWTMDGCTMEIRM
jgi:hypothetical protein